MNYAIRDLAATTGVSIVSGPVGTSRMTGKLQESCIDRPTLLSSGTGGRLTRTVIVRINGSIDDPLAGYRWKGNYLITQDHYIDYLGGRSAEEVTTSRPV